MVMQNIAVKSENIWFRLPFSEIFFYIWTTKHLVYYIIIVELKVIYRYFRALIFKQMAVIIILGKFLHSLIEMKYLNFLSRKVNRNDSKLSYHSWHKQHMCPKNFLLNTYKTFEVPYMFHSRQVVMKRLS